MVDISKFEFLEYVRQQPGISNAAPYELDPGEQILFESARKIIEGDYCHVILL